MKKNSIPALILLCACAGFSPLVTMSPAQCNSYPLAVSAATLANLNSGDVVTNIFDGSQTVGTGWLTWTGKIGDEKLIKSLTGTGDCQTYVNPLKPWDHDLRAGDWVRSKPGIADTTSVCDALDLLKQNQIVIPVWDEARGQGPNALYHISDFAVIQILSYDIPSRRITAVFVAFASCREGGHS